jgi:adenosylcobinamide kinase / adenosylcobinamide-phosphate guanylyltransferase
MGRLQLVLGGAGSGKSAYAERLAAEIGPRVLYVATGEAIDPEMAGRIRRHRARRPRGWRTVEAPTQLLPAIAAFDEPVDCVLLDSITVWISNLYCRDATTSELEWTSLTAVGRSALRSTNELIDWQRHQPVELVVVSDETGFGLVPSEP